MSDSIRRPSDPAVDRTEQNQGHTPSADTASEPPRSRKSSSGAAQSRYARFCRTKIFSMFDLCIYSDTGNMTLIPDRSAFAPVN